MNLATLTLLLVGVGSVIIRIPGAAGGWRGMWHTRVREPFLTAVGATALYFVGSWLVGRPEGQPGATDWDGMGGVMIAFAMVIWLIATVRTSSALSVRRLDAERIADELDTLLDPTDTHFVVDDSNAHRPLELLNELSQLIGPGKYAPGQPWATHEWIAERMPAAHAVKPGESSRRIDQSTS